MKVGDIVRFARWEEIIDINDWSTTPKTHLGLLVSHDKLGMTAEILCEDEIINSRVQLVEKAGKKGAQKKS